MTTDRATTIRQMAEQMGYYCWHCQTFKAVPLDCTAQNHGVSAMPQAAIEAFGQAVAARAEQRASEFVSSRDFYELMQVYRHTPRHELQATVDAFEAVKAAIRSAAGREE